MAIKYTFFAVCLGGLLCSCQEPSAADESAANSAAADPTESAANAGEEESLLDKLKKEALPSDDLLGRLRQGLTRLQQGYDDSDARMSSIEKVTVDIDANCLLTISNQADGGSKIEVNLKDLDTKGLSLIPDQAQGEFPGLRIKTIDNEPRVLHYQKGKLVNKNDELVIYLADRPAIESVTPAILQSIYLCQGMIE